MTTTNTKSTFNLKDVAGYNFSTHTYSTNNADTYAFASSGKQAVVFGYILGNGTGSPITIGFYQAGASLIHEVVVPANSTITHFFEHGICASPDGAIGRTAQASGTASGTKTIIWKYV